MENFTFQNPTKIHFGKGQIARLAEEVPEDAAVLLLYGGGSIKKNGVYDQVLAALGGREIVEYGGIEANPDFDTLLPAAKLAAAKPNTFIVAVGGGSVLDGAKFVAAAAHFPGDPWTILAPTFAPVAKAVPLGAVLTLPGTGSESNGASVISRRATGEKLHFISPQVFPRFAVLDPDTMLSLPREQLANGIGDAFTHVLEQYLTYPAGAAVQDQFAEGVMRVLVQEGKACINKPQDYTHRANVMWACCLALNGLIGVGVPQDWASHMIGHELTALFGIDHARTLAVVMPSLISVKSKDKWDKLLQYAQRVWALEARDGEPADHVSLAINRTRSFYESLGLKTRLRDYPGVNATEAAAQVAQRLAKRGMTALGERADITPAVVEQILKGAA
jgi:NADP-dependent alcohol dehydrogenase